MAAEHPDRQPYKSMTGKLDASLLKGLEVMGYEYMSPVQQKVLTELPTFSSDCLVQAKTGTGKTIAFLLPVLHNLLNNHHNLRKGQVACLILSPTRELALQIAKECELVTSQVRSKIECHTAFGGTSKDRNLKQFLNGDPKILVATPGRLNDYLSDEYVAERFIDIKTLILDEADTMLEAGFLVAINQILAKLPQKAQAGWQGMCFSATMPPKIQGVLPKVLGKDHTYLTTIDPNETPTIDAVTQFSVVYHSIHEVYTHLYALINREFESSSGDFKAIVFGTTANGVALMHSLFEKLMGGKMRVSQLQSRMTQSARTRTTNEYKEAKAGLMFASDVIGRGMDFPNVNLVIQVGLPSSGEQYVHRVGRTARAGNEGRAVILLSDRESFFLKVNKQLPINPYPESLDQVAMSLSPAVTKAFYSVDESTKNKAYQAWLGFNKTSMKQLQLDANGLVALANEHAEAMGCPETPMMDKSVVGKMGLKGVKGLNVGRIERAPRGQPQAKSVQNQGHVAMNGGAGAGRNGSNNKRPANSDFENRRDGPSDFDFTLGREWEEHRNGNQNGGGGRGNRQGGGGRGRGGGRGGGRGRGRGL